MMRNRSSWGGVLRDRVEANYSGDHCPVATAHAKMIALVVM